MGQHTLCVTEGERRVSQPMTERRTATAATMGHRTGGGTTWWGRQDTDGGGHLQT